MAGPLTGFLPSPPLSRAPARTGRPHCLCSASPPPPSPPSRHAVADAPALSRRSFLSAVAAAAAAAAASVASLTAAPPPAEAYEDIPQLPPGARQLDNLLKSRVQWAAIGTTVSERHDVMDTTEWNNVRTYLRKFYSVGDDMVALGKGRGKESKQAVEGIAKALRKTVKEYVLKLVSPVEKCASALERVGVWVRDAVQSCAPGALPPSGLDIPRCLGTGG